MELSGKIALVTGASRGIGRGIALQLGEAGATVYVTGRQPNLLSQVNQENYPTLEETAEEVSKRGGKGIPVYVDHADMEEVEKLFQRIEQETHGQLDILVNNAFSAVKQLQEINGRKFWEMEPGFWDEVNNVGLRNHYYCSVYAARMMVTRRTGFIVNISSPGGIMYLMSVAYGVGKTAKDRMASDMALELRDHGVAVVSLWPGAVRTEISRKLIESSEYSKRQAPNLQEMIRESETPELTGKAVVALAMDPNLMKKTGRTLVVADLGIDYKFLDIDGRQPSSVRSFKMAFTLLGLANIGAYFPVWLRIPGWLMTALYSRL